VTTEEKIQRAKAERAARRARMPAEELAELRLPLGEFMKRAASRMTQDYKDILGEIAEKRKHERF
jgi:hypothetical protein